MGLSEAPLLLKLMFGGEVLLGLVQILLIHVMINHTHGDN